MHAGSLATSYIVHPMIFPASHLSARYLDGPQLQDSSSWGCGICYDMHSVRWFNFVWQLRVVYRDF